MAIEVEQIDRTVDTDDPVFRAQSATAQMTFIFPTTLDHDLLIHTVTSDGPGGMSGLLDHVCREYECEHVRFSTPLSDQLDHKLDGFERVEETIDRGPMEGEKWVCLDGYWRVDD